ncbi:MAG TPA: hypothetical protein VLS45_01580, partial [Methylomicrobium sp.]|nr:hypothetical protein [Methylomicrobium sp.]
VLPDAACHAVSVPESAPARIQQSYLERNLQNSINREELVAGMAKKRKMSLLKSDKVGSSKTRKSSTNEQVT